jgi:hypothetical protein
MPRKSLKEVDTNSRRETELSPYIQLKVATLRAEDIIISKITDRIKISKNTIK